MKSATVVPVVHADILDGGVVITFADGQGAFLSATVLHRAVSKAEELPEFLTVEQRAMISQPARRLASESA